jgi:hypothetical protein
MVLSSETPLTGKLLTRVGECGQSGWSGNHCLKDWNESTRELLLKILYGMRISSGRSFLPARPATLCFRFARPATLCFQCLTPRLAERRIFRPNAARLCFKPGQVILQVTPLYADALKSGHFAKSRLKRFADDADATNEGGSNKGFTVKTRCLRPIRESISSVLLRGINGFHQVSRHQAGAAL